MGLELGRALLLADAVTPDALANALLASVRDRVSLVRALLSTEAIGISRLEEELALTAPEAPLQRHPVPVLELLARLPPELCESLLAVPVRSDPRTGTVDVALADATISSRHAVIHVDPVGGTIAVEDTGSTNGTFVNDEHLGFSGRRDLRDGDHLRLGGFTTIVKIISRT